MDPFSVVVGAVALTEVANKLSGTLTDRYKAFTSAPKQMMEIAGQIILCAGLVDVFAKSVDGSGGTFPRKFKQDATLLVKQCRSILKEIDEMIPSGSRKPDYQQRLKYAFRDEKKIVKHQDRLKQVQHMFMFMTTCWMYQLPPPHTSQQPKQPFGPTSSDGSFSLSQSASNSPPMQFSLKGFGGMHGNDNYEAILTLTPLRAQEAAAAGSAGSLRPARSAPKPPTTISNSQKSNLENMRRSPYFSLNLLKVPLEADRNSRTASSGSASQGEERSRMGAAYIDEELRVGKVEKMEKGDEKRDFEPISKQQAEKDIGKIISEWFSGDIAGDDTPQTTTTFCPPVDPHDSRLSPIIKDSYLTTASPPRSLSSSTSSFKPTPIGSTYSGYLEWPPTGPITLPPRSASNPSPIVRVAEKWDWRCDKCDKKYYYHQQRFKCQDCSNFDFCPQCYSTAWHQHPPSSFVERSL